MSLSHCYRLAIFFGLCLMDELDFAMIGLDDLRDFKKGNVKELAPLVDAVHAQMSKGSV